MNKRGVYFVWTVLGGIAPLSALAMFLARYGLDVPEFFRQLVASPISTMILIDVSLASVVFWVWMIPQARRDGIPAAWIVVANLFVALSFALPLFLYLRERREAVVQRGFATPTLGSTPR